MRRRPLVFTKSRIKRMGSPSVSVNTSSSLLVVCRCVPSDKLPDSHHSNSSPPSISKPYPRALHQTIHSASLPQTRQLVVRETNSVAGQRQSFAFPISLAIFRGFVPAESVSADRSKSYLQLPQFPRLPNCRSVSGTGYQPQTVSGRDRQVFRNGDRES